MQQQALDTTEIDFSTRFSLNKFTLHNSAMSSIVSLDVNINTQLISTNGAGKTATMNAIQIGFLPWNNFTDSKRKFYFIDSKGNPYSDEKSYHFYFPHENSFMLFEFTNPHGTFTQVVYRSGDNLGIHRAFLPLSIDDIYNWFWAFDEDAQFDELGAPTRISLSGLKEKFKTVAGIRYVKSPSDAKKVLYNGNLTQSEGVYSIARVGEKNIDNLVDIFRLTAKASDISDEKIKSICISLITSSYLNNERDKLNFKPQELLAQFDRLNQDSESLQVRENEQHTFNNIKDSYGELAALGKELTAESTLLHQSIIESRHQNATEINQIDLKLDRVKAKFNQQNAQKEQVKSLYNESVGEMKSLKADVESKSKEVLHYEWLRKGAIPGLRLGKDRRYQERADTTLFESDYDVIKVTREDIDELEASLSKYQDRQKLWAHIKQLQGEIDGYQREHNSCKRSIERIESRTGIFDAPSIKFPERLVALNSAFSSLNAKVAEQYAAQLNGLTDVFYVENEYLHLNFDTDNITFGKVKQEEDVAALYQKLDQLEFAIAKAEKIKADSVAVYESEGEFDPEPIQQQISMMKIDIAVIEKISHIYDEQKERQERLETLKIEVSKKNEIIKEADGFLSQTKLEMQSLSEQHKDAVSIQRGIDTIQADFKRVLDNHGFTYDLNAADKLRKDSLIKNVTSENVTFISDIISKTATVKDNIITKLSHMIIKGVISDSENCLARSVKNFSDIHRQLFIPLARLYEDLPQEKQLVSDQIRKHTDTTIEISNVLKTQIRHYKNAIKTLNDTLGKFTISNIDDMRLKMELSPRVESFIRTIDSMGLEGTVTDISTARAVFSHVRDFVKNMNISENKMFSVTAEMLIEHIGLEFKHESIWTDTTGSNGQTLVSTAVLLSMFIEHICGEGIHLSIPINVDEVNNIDYNNVVQLADFLKSKNLIMFSASPEVGIGHDGIFSNYISIDDSQIHDKDIILSPLHYTVFHHFFGSMYKKEDFEVGDEFDHDDSMGELVDDALSASVSIYER